MLDRCLCDHSSNSILILCAREAKQSLEMHCSVPFIDKIQLVEGIQSLPYNLAEHSWASTEMVYIFKFFLIKIFLQNWYLNPLSHV